MKLSKEQVEAYFKIVNASLSRLEINCQNCKYYDDDPESDNYDRCKKLAIIPDFWGFCHEWEFKKGPDKYFL
jgi:hypothetical protein